MPDGVFFHTSYDVTYLSDQADDLSFRPMHPMRIAKTSFCLLNKRCIIRAIVKYGREPSIQLNILTCQPKVG